MKINGRMSVTVGMKHDNGLTLAVRPLPEEVMPIRRKENRPPTKAAAKDRLSRLPMTVTNQGNLQELPNPA
jgi:hypothetical protein